MAKKANKSIYRRGNSLWKFGVWATAWWALSWLYFLLLFVMSLEVYADLTLNQNEGFLADWWNALSQTYSEHMVLQVLLFVIVTGWFAGVIFWLRELNKANVSLKAALKDLFFTLR